MNEKEEVRKGIGENIKRLKVPLQGCVGGTRSESVEVDEFGKETEPGR